MILIGEELNVMSQVLSRAMKERNPQTHSGVCVGAGEERHGLSGSECGPGKEGPGRNHGVAGDYRPGIYRTCLCVSIRPTLWPWKPA